MDSASDMDVCQRLPSNNAEPNARNNSPLLVFFRSARQPITPVDSLITRSLYRSLPRDARHRPKLDARAAAPHRVWIDWRQTSCQFANTFSSPVAPFFALFMLQTHRRRIALDIIAFLAVRQQSSRNLRSARPSNAHWFFTAVLPFAFHSHGALARSTLLCCPVDVPLGRRC